ncbi:MAG: glycosyltransferase family 1 protein [Spirochaetia bacterium]|nr:glycosyltransferase family 1 protein [Spirochaetia bacterium]
MFEEIDYPSDSLKLVANKGAGLKIVILANSLLGLYNFRFELVQRLKRDKYQITIFAPDDEISFQFIQLGCRFIPVPVSRRGTNPYQDFNLFQTYFRFLKSNRPSIVLSYTIKPNIYGGLACKLLNIPYIVNITGLGTAVENKGALQVFTLLLYRIALSKAQRVFFQNTENKAFFEKKRIALGKHGLLPGSGVNLTKFQPMEYPSDDTIEFVFISRIMKEKGIDHYLEMAQVIKAKYPNTRFHICGDCEESYEETLQKLHQDGTVIYHGRIDDVREVLNITHCTIHPSYYPEGLSNVLLESSACGRPIITTNRSGCREVVDEGKNGFLVKIKDTEDLIAKVEAFIALPYEKKKQMGIAGREKVEREFDREIVVDAYMREIENILEESEKKDKKK